MEKLEEFLEWGGTKKDITCLVLPGIALAASIAKIQVFGVDVAWLAILLCGTPIILEAIIGQLGGLLEDLTVAKARAGIEKLVHLTPRTARVLKDGAETVIPAEQVKVGDILRVLPGETIAVDGVILSGQTSINQAVMTGESTVFWFDFGYHQFCISVCKASATMLS